MVKIGDFFLYLVTLKKIGHRFYATSSFVHNFIAIYGFKLELQSGNSQIGAQFVLTSATCFLVAAKKYAVIPCILAWNKSTRNLTPRNCRLVAQHCSQCTRHEMDIQGWIVIADLWEEEHGHSCKPLLKETHREARENLNVISISGQQMKICMDNLQKWFLTITITINTYVGWPKYPARASILTRKGSNHLHKLQSGKRIGNMCKIFPIISFVHVLLQHFLQWSGDSIYTWQKKLRWKIISAVWLNI